jgi:hypothetical protein
MLDYLLRMQCLVMKLLIHSCLATQEVSGWLYTSDKTQVRMQTSDATLINRLMQINNT